MGATQTHQRRCLWTPQGFTTLDPYTIFTEYMVLQVHDIEKSKIFYSEIVGLKIAPQSPPDAVLFLTIPIPFAVRKPHVNLDAVNQLCHGFALWFYCDNSIELCNHLKKNGIIVLDEPAPTPFGMTFRFKDIDGYVITAHDKASFNIYLNIFIIRNSSVFRSVTQRLFTSDLKTLEYISILLFRMLLNKFYNP